MLHGKERPLAKKLSEREYLSTLWPLDARGIEEGKGHTSAITENFSMILLVVCSNHGFGAGARPEQHINIIHEFAFDNVGILFLTSHVHKYIQRSIAVVVSGLFDCFFVEVVDLQNRDTSLLQLVQPFQTRVSNPPRWPRATGMCDTTELGIEEEKMTLWDL